MSPSIRPSAYNDIIFTAGNNNHVHWALYVTRYSRADLHYILQIIEAATTKTEVMLPPTEHFQNDYDDGNNNNNDDNDDDLHYREDDWVKGPGSPHVATVDLIIDDEEYMIFCKGCLSGKQERRWNHSPHT